MSIMELGALGEFVGSIAILITLIYLAIQIRQAGRSTTFAAVQANRTERMTWFRQNRDSPYLPPIFKKVETGEALSEEDTYRLNSHNSALWGFIYSQWIQQELGLAGRFATPDSAVVGLALGTPGAIEWWEGAGASVYPAEFCDYVQDRLRTLRQQETVSIRNIG